MSAATRREAIAGLAFAATIGAIPTSAALAKVAPDRAAWDGAMAAYVKANADYRREQDRWNRAGETYQSITGYDTFGDAHYDEAAARLSGFTQADHMIGEWGERMVEAADKLIEMPAPDAEAVLWKIDHLWGDDPTSAYCEEWMEKVLADLRRHLTTGRA